MKSNDLLSRLVRRVNEVGREDVKKHTFTRCACCARFIFAPQNSSVTTRGVSPVASEEYTGLGVLCSDECWDRAVDRMVLAGWTLDKVKNPNKTTRATWVDGNGGEVLLLKYAWTREEHNQFVKDWLAAERKAQEDLIEMGWERISES